uniref:RING-CH-type domain-containing protein n=1 Tax=Setaria digitata TaxID=48799 RepID=A0A915PNE3_9BILA
MLFIISLFSSKLITHEAIKKIIISKKIISKSQISDNTWKVSVKDWKRRDKEHCKITDKLEQLFIVLSNHFIELSVVDQEIPGSHVGRIDSNTAVSSTNKDLNLDETQMSHVPLTTSYVIKSQRQKPNQTVAIYFAPMKKRRDMALTEIQLCNDADAAPAGSGCIPPRAEQRCFLTWRRPSNTETEDMKTPKLILITNFVEKEIDNTQTVITKLIARMHSEGDVANDQVPLMKFTFERKEEVVVSDKALTSCKEKIPPLSEYECTISAFFHMWCGGGFLGSSQNPFHVPHRPYTREGHFGKHLEMHRCLPCTPYGPFWQRDLVFGGLAVIADDSLEVLWWKCFSRRRGPVKEIKVKVSRWEEIKMSRIFGLYFALTGSFAAFCSSMDEEMIATVSATRFDSNSKVSYLSSMEIDVALLPLPSQHASTEHIRADRSKICRYCLSDDDTGEWLAPCKCIGTMKWVHTSCFMQWLSLAPATMKYSCAICNYVYRRQWRLKPYKCWHWPQFHLRIADLFGIYFDLTLTYRLYRYFPRCLDNRVTFFLYASYVLLWKLVVLSRMRLNFYSNIAYDIATSICSSTVLDAL